MATLEQEFKKFVEPFVDDIFKYSMHSMRSGAASNTASINMDRSIFSFSA